MNRRTFTLAGFFGAIGAIIGKALGYDGASKSETITVVEPAVRYKRQVHAIKIGRHFYVNGTGEPLKDLPEGVKHWSEGRIFDKLEDTNVHRATIGDLSWLQRELEEISRRPPWETYPHAIRDRVRELALALHHEIHRQASFCSGHNGPSPLGETTEMPDGRRLCPYCYKQETDHGLQLEGSERDQTPSV